MARRGVSARTVTIRRRISRVDGIAAVEAALAGAGDRATVATASRYLLEQLAEDAEGHTVEVRVPPFGAVQAVPGPRHTRHPGSSERGSAACLQRARGLYFDVDGRSLP